MEYLLLVTLVGIGAIVGLAMVRNALVTELNDVATAITQLHNPSYVQPVHATCDVVFTAPAGTGG
jgi:Flp pilus assembly pilin Flp